MERQQKIVQDRRNLVDSGILARSEFQSYEQELEARERVLEHLRIPYLAFRSAFAGAATAPHIHIGLGSTRLVMAAR